MITLKKKLAGALMAFALVASVLVGGVGDSASGANWSSTCSGEVIIIDAWEIRAIGINCSGAWKATARQTYYTSSATNARVYPKCGLFKSSGTSISVLSQEQYTRKTYGHRLTNASSPTCD
ncbi:MAG: hypothetical protein LBL41_05395 [Bifidobacteriaceae bacterium]|jgi:hypothetical protein|nr:hypothetical protein [Bifidobacteriaceae bacterium]